MTRTPNATAARGAALGCLALLTVSFAGTGLADPAPRATGCPGAPRAPNGHALARIVDVAGEGGGTRVVLDKGTSAKVMHGNRAYVLSCDGGRMMSGGFAVERATQDSAWGTVRGMREAEVRGAWVAVDVGYASKPPPVSGLPEGHETADIVVASVEDGWLEIGINRGADDGVLPGDKGFVLTASGGHVENADFEIDRVSERVAYGRTRMRGPDALRGTTMRAAVKPHAKRCSVPGRAPDFGGSRDVATGRVAPRGFAFANVMTVKGFDYSSGAHEITVDFDRGSDDGVLPSSSAYVPTPGSGAALPVTVDVRSVTKNTGRAVIRGGSKATEALIRRLGVEIGACR